MINLLTSPDYINQKIVQFIESRLATAAMLQHSYEYAASFEDFLKVISSTNTLDELASIRSSIVNDIMQATTQQNIQRSKGLDPDLEQSTFTKSEIAAAVKLKRYIQQLSYAKAQCEKNLMKLGWKGGFANDLVRKIVSLINTNNWFNQFLCRICQWWIYCQRLSVDDTSHYFWNHCRPVVLLDSISLLKSLNIPINRHIINWGLRFFTRIFERHLHPLKLTRYEGSVTD